MQSMWISNSDEQILQVQTKRVLFPVGERCIARCVKSRREHVGMIESSMCCYFSENEASVSSFLSASSMATISSSRQVFFEENQNAMNENQLPRRILPSENRRKMPSERSTGVLWCLDKRIGRSCSSNAGEAIYKVR